MDPTAVGRAAAGGLQVACGHGDHGSCGFMAIGSTRRSGGRCQMPLPELRGGRLQPEPRAQAALWPRGDPAIRCGSASSRERWRLGACVLPRGLGAAGARSGEYS
jgi:hypothetical protein